MAMAFGDHHGMHDMHHDHAATMAVSDASVADDSTPSHKLCQSAMGMVMYMEGFQWTLKGKGTCLNFFFESWMLDTAPKFVAAMVCVVAMGIATEGISRWKHDVAQKARETDSRRNTINDNRLRVMHTCLQGLSIMSAYMLMLVVMTYSLELLSCVILGLMIGYYIFDGDSLHHRGGTPCCNFLEGGGSDGTEAGTSLTEALLPRTTSLGGGSDSDNNVSRPTTISNGTLGINGHSCCNDDGVDNQNEEEGI